MIDSALLQSLLYERNRGIMVLPPRVHELVSSEKSKRFVQDVIDAHVREIEDMLDMPVRAELVRGRAVFLRAYPGAVREGFRDGAAYPRDEGRGLGN